MTSRLPTVGDRVRVVSDWSTYRGRKGTVTEARAPVWYMVRVDGEDSDVRFGAEAIEVAS